MLITEDVHKKGEFIMKAMKRFLIVCSGLLVILSYSYTAAAKNVRYGFNSSFFYKQETIHGRVEITRRCENKVDVIALGISDYTVSSWDIFVSPDERYFIFQGSYGRHGRMRVFLADSIYCKVIRELTLGEKYDTSTFFNAAFSPDSKRLYISWNITPPPPDKIYNNFDELMSAYKGRETIWQTKEYGGDGFINERILKNVTIPMTGSKISTDGRYLVKEITPVIVKVGNIQGVIYLGLAIYDLTKDIELYKIEKREDYLGQKKYFKGENIPDISDGLLLFNFDSDGGTEIDIFDYVNKKIKNKIEISLKGSGMFSSKGNRVIFTSFPDMETWSKEVIIYDMSTGKKLGTATLDEADEIVDVSANDKELICRRDNVEKRVELKKE